MSKIANLKKYHLELLLPMIIIAVFLTFASPYFATMQNMRNVGNQIAINLIIGLGMTLLISSGGIDLSVGANVAVTGVVVALFFQPGYDSAGAACIGVLIGIAVGTLIGFINGMIISNLKVPPFICTLGTAMALQGLALVFSRGRPIMGMPDNFLHIFSGFFLGIPRPVITMIFMILLCMFLLNRTTLGRTLLAIGGNETCVRICGINVKRAKVIAYSLTGALTGLASLVLTTTMATADPLAGAFYDLNAIAIVVMGGTSLQGGKGTIIGTTLGAFLLGLVRNGMNLLRIHASYHTFIVGLLILFSIVLTSDMVQARLQTALAYLSGSLNKEECS